MFMTEILDSVLVALLLLRPTRVTVLWMDEVESRGK